MIDANTNKNNRYKIITYNPKDKLNALICFLITQSSTNEEWRELPIGYGYYMVSSKGRVLSLYNNIPRELKQFTNNGYKYVRIDGKDKRINRLVANAFIPNTDKLPVVHHLDGNKLNNDVSNLQWTTYSENTKEYYKLKEAQERAAAGL